VVFIDEVAERPQDLNEAIVGGLALAEGRGFKWLGFIPNKMTGPRKRVWRKYPYWESVVVTRSGQLRVDGNNALGEEDALRFKVKLVSRRSTNRQFARAHVTRS
jgi:hypothetical protein